MLIILKLIFVLHNLSLRMIYGIKVYQ